VYNTNISSINICSNVGCKIEPVSLYLFTVFSLIHIARLLVDEGVLLERLASGVVEGTSFSDFLSRDVLRSMFARPGEVREMFFYSRAIDTTSMLGFYSRSS
jgi:hypothetical protein